MTLHVNEFLRRFCMHILPYRFRKVRHYGFLSGRNKKKSLQQARKSLNADTPRKQPTDWRTVLSNKYGINPDICPKCKKGNMKTIQKLEIGQKYYPP